MRGRRLNPAKIPAIAYFAVLVVGVLVGIVVPGGTGDLILEISAALLALSVFATIGIGKGARDSWDRRGRRRY